MTKNPVLQKKTIKKFNHPCGFLRLISYIVDKAAKKAQRKTIVNWRIVGKTQLGWFGARCVLTACLIFSLVGYHPLTNAASQSSPQFYDINIPSLNAAEALNRLAEQTGATFLFPYGIAEARQANSVVGSYSLMDALKLLLKDSGLSVGLSKKGVLKISLVESETLNNEGKNMKAKRPMSYLTAFFASVFAASPVAVQGAENSSSSILEEVIVTAQKRSQNQQDVPISMAALTGNMIDELGMATSSELVSHIPNLSIGTPLGEGSNPAFSLRGVGLNDFQDANEAPIAMYVDGVYLGTQAGQVLQLFDIERVEVLRGPQGTLYGRNATGGLLHFISAKPTKELEGYVNLTVGTKDTKNIEAVISGPLTDNVQARLSVADNNADGWIRNTIGENGNTINNTSGRLQLAYQPSEDLDILLSVNKTKVDQNGSMNSHRGTRWADAALTIPCTLEQALVPDTCYDAGGYKDDFSDPRKGAWNFVSPLEIDVTGARASIDYTLDNGMEFVSITSYVNTKRHWAGDIDGSPNTCNCSNNLTSEFAIDSTQITQEFRLSGETEKFNWVTGFFYWDDDKQSPWGSRQQEFEIVGRVAAETEFRIESQSWAVFGQTDYNLTDNLVLTGGVRYTSDEKDFEYSHLRTFPVVIQFYDDDTSDGKFTDVSWKGGLTYTISEDAMVYASISKGFKSGGFNARYMRSGTQEELEPYQEEELIAYEVGAKTSWLDDRLRLNASAFYYDYKDMQFITFNNLGSTYDNVDAESYGAELEGTWAVADNFEVIFGLGVMESEILGTAFSQGGVPLKGNETALSPGFQANAIFRYSHEVGDLGSLVFQLDGNYVGKQFWSIDNIPFHEQQESYNVWNLAIAYKSPNERFDVRLEVENVFDEEYSVYGVDSVARGVARLYPTRDPKWTTLSVKYNF